VAASIQIGLVEVDKPQRQVHLPAVRGDLPRSQDLVLVAAAAALGGIVTRSYDLNPPARGSARGTFWRSGGQRLAFLRVPGNGLDTTTRRLKLAGVRGSVNGDFGHLFP
jgi:hypothetical protein